MGIDLIQIFFFIIVIVIPVWLWIAFNGGEPMEAIKEGLSLIFVFFLIFASVWLIGIILFYAWNTIANLFS